MNCTDLMFTCPGYGTQPQLKSWDGDRSYTHREDRVFTFKSGSVNMPINKRTRSYEYKSHEQTRNSNNKRVIVPDGLGTYEVDCYDSESKNNASINEDYNTLDVTFYYADLRDDLFIYKKTEKHLYFNQNVDFKIPLKTSYDDAHLYPFIVEEVPIKIRETIMCTSGNLTLHSTTQDDGYLNDVNLLMPLFNGGDPRCTKFTINGKEYDACVVDWYYMDEGQRTADGDQFFWYADWIKSVAIHADIDKAEAETLASTYLPYGPKTPKDFTSGNGICKENFMGSAAVDREDNLFLSAVFDKEGNKFKFNKLIIDGEDTPIPQEKGISSDIWYPIAPL